MRRTPALLVRAIAASFAACLSSCQTVVTETRAEPVLQHSELAGKIFQGGVIKVQAIEAGHAGNIQLVTTQHQLCLDRFIDAKSTTVTKTTQVVEGQKNAAVTTATVGGAVLVVGALAGGALAPFVYFDPRAKEGDRYVPVADQDGFALWPVGLGIAGAAAVLSAPLLATLPITALHEHVDVSEELTKVERSVPATGCDKDEPAVGVPIIWARSGATLATTEKNGSAQVDLAPLIDSVLVEKSSTSLLIGEEPVRIDVVIEAGFATAVTVKSRTASITLPAAGFEGLVAFNAGHQREIDNARREAEKEAERRRVALDTAESEIAVSCSKLTVEAFSASSEIGQTLSAQLKQAAGDTDLARRPRVAVCVRKVASLQSAFEAELAQRALVTACAGVADAQGASGAFCIDFNLNTALGRGAEVRVIEGRAATDEEWRAYSSRCRSGGPRLRAASQAVLGLKTAFGQAKPNEELLSMLRQGRDNAKQCLAVAKKYEATVLAMVTGLGRQRLAAQEGQAERNKIDAAKQDVAAARRAAAAAGEESKRLRRDVDNQRDASKQDAEAAQRAAAAAGEESKRLRRDVDNQRAEDERKRAEDERKRADEKRSQEEANRQHQQLTDMERKNRCNDRCYQDNLRRKEQCRLRFGRTAPHPEGPGAACDA